jgi:Fe-S cluster biogenesis protein NfuA/nitrite reductase/ring-hydroxylating ferredoxin subunit
MSAAGGGAPVGTVAQAGERIEELLASLRAVGDRVADTAEELVTLLVGLYGDGLTRIAEMLREDGGAGAAVLHKLAEDPLVESLLLLHGLHPLDLDSRVQRALDRVRPYLGSHAGGVQYLGVADGVARLRLEGSCHGCPSSTVTVRLAIEGAVRDAAPEVNEVVVEGMTEPAGPPLLQIGPRPGGGGMQPGVQDPGTGGAGAADTPSGSWVPLPDIGPPSSRPLAVSADGHPVLICAVRGTLYAYQDACAVCGSSLADGTLEREMLSCPGCGCRYDVRLAGRSAHDPAVHLEPLPLLSDSQGVRVALPSAVRA